MRTSLFSFAVVALCACPGSKPISAPPDGGFYFPSGLVHEDDPNSPEGLLYVVSSNFDKRYDFGTITAVDLSTIGLPAFGASVAASGPVAITDLKIHSGSVAFVASFGGEMAPYEAANGVHRLFLPTRSEGQALFAFDAPPLSGAGAAPEIHCVPDVKANADGSMDCTKGGWSLVANETDRVTSQPRAPSPIGVSVNQASGEVWVAHAAPADTPRGTGLNYISYLVRTSATDPGITNDSFVNIGIAGGTHAVAIGNNWVFASGRYAPIGMLLTRMVQSGNDVANGDRLVLNSGLEAEIRVGEARGIALSTDHRRLYIAGRSPDALVVADVQGADTPLPTVPYVRTIRSVPLPEAPQVVRALPRTGRSDLVLVPCASAGVLAIYDDDVGDLVAQVPGIGQQPGEMTVDMRPPGARVFISNFTDGRVAVVDIPDLNRPQEARVVAQLGRSQLCVTRGFNDTSCANGGTVQ